MLNMTSSSPKRLECIKDLIRTARNSRFSTLRKLATDDQDVYDVWDSVSQIIEFHMNRKKAVQIPGLGTFTFTSSKLDIGHNKFILIQRPVFILSEKLARTHRLTQSKYHVPGEIPVIQLNFMALSYELNMDRDLVEASIKEVVNALSRAIEQTGSAEFGLTTVGNLVIQNGIAKMKFLPSFIEQIDQTGGLARYLSKRPETSNSVLSDKSFILPKIELGEDINNIPNKSTDIYDIKEESDSKEYTSQSNKQPKKESSPGKEAFTPLKTKKENLTASLKIEPKTPVVQQISFSKLEDATGTPIGTPRNSFKGKKTVAYKDSKNDADPATNMFPTTSKSCDISLSNSFSKNKSVPMVLKLRSQDKTVCNSCAESMNDFCYLCYQREKRNVPIYYDEDRKKEEQEEDRLLQMYTLLRDSKSLIKEQELNKEKRGEAQRIAAFNLGVSEKLKEQKEKRPTEFQRSYVFHHRPITPPHFIKQENYRQDLAEQVNEKDRRFKQQKLSKDNIERIEQLQLAENLAAQRNHYLKSKRLQSDEYRKALDTQVIYRSSDLPAAYPDSDGPVFGVHDMNDEKQNDRRKRARNLYLNQVKMAEKKRENEFTKDACRKREEEAMLKKVKHDLLQETLARNQIHLSQRQDLEKTWAAHALSKRAKEMEERMLARSPGMLLQEQCDKYKRCGQCNRYNRNVGQSNVWTESRYVSGSRLMV